MPEPLSWDVAADDDPLGVLATNRDLASEGRIVRIVPEAARSLARSFEPGPVGAEWDETYHYTGDADSTAQYVYVLDALNFCFWGEPRWQVEHADGWVNGYYALALALKRAIERGAPVLEADWMVSVNPAGLARILGGRNEIPLLTERANNLNDAGALLRSRYQGRFLAMVEACQSSATVLAATLAQQLSSYNDVAWLDGAHHRFYKRAQICASDLASSLDGRSSLALSDLSRLTAFADYKIPQVLRELGVLEYSRDLAQVVDSRIPILPGSAPEVAIRAATVWAVEHLCREASVRGRRLAPRQIDWQLWLLGQNTMSDTRPYHLTRTIFY
jgi:hypothetical protein